MSFNKFHLVPNKFHSLDIDTSNWPESTSFYNQLTK